MEEQKEERKAPAREAVPAVPQAGPAPAGGEAEAQALSGLFAILEKSGRTYDYDKIREAYRLAAELHSGQTRQSGEPYIVHPIAVAEIVAELGLDTDSICAAFLHDTVEDCSDKTSLSEISRRFGKDVALLVDGVTKIRNIQNVHVEDKEEEHVENIRKMLLAMSKDIRVIFIKLCAFQLYRKRTNKISPYQRFVCNIFMFSYGYSRKIFNREIFFQKSFRIFS